MRVAAFRIKLLAALIASALAGLAVVQFVMLRKTIAAEEDAFRRNATVALSKAADVVTAGEILRLIVAEGIDTTGAERCSPETIDSLIRDLQFSWDSRDDNYYLHFQDTSEQIGDISTTDTGNGRDAQLIQIEVHSDVKADGLVFLTDSIFHKRLTPPDRITDGQTTFVIDSGGFRGRSTYSVFTTKGLSDSARQVLISATLSRLEDQEAIPIVKRIDTLKLDSAIHASLEAEGIDLEYSYGIVAALSNRILYSNNPTDTAAIMSSPIRSRLFPHDVLSPPRDLAVFFPSKQRYLMNQMVPVAAPAVLCLVVIAFAFAYTIRVMIGQQRFAVRLTDFINNMTHEFKTPISTIQLASEALLRDEILADRNRITQFNQMIREENRRMKLQVDKILQMAVIEDGAAEIKHEPIDLHEIIRAATETAKLAVTTRHGRIECRLDAARSVVSGDELHLFNIVLNLLDNACKYSPDDPDIRISTELRGDKIILRISDRGIGIADEDRKRIFERYYRVNTGDRHDVKGFGLGLSYVKLVVEALHGSVHVNSALGKGTEITVELPLSVGQE